MSVLARAGGLFLQPEVAAAPRTAPAPPRPVGSAAVLAAATDLPAAAGAVAAHLRGTARTRTAVVCRPGGVPAARPATPSAARLARRLADRDHDAVAAGALCRVALPHAPAEAVRMTWRLIGAVEVPLVLALPGWIGGFDPLLSELDHLFLATPEDADPAIAELALASLRALGPPVTQVHPPATAFARRRAALGLAAIRVGEPVTA